MKRRIIKIDKDACIGCGLCAEACHEGAIGMVDGKAVLLREDYCDGLGDCLPACPVGAITFEEREAPAYDEAAVLAAKAAKEAAPAACGCPGSAARSLGGCPGSAAREMKAPSPAAEDGIRPGMLSQWPVQIQLVPVSAPFFRGADLLVAADCAAFAHGDFHRRFIDGRITLIGCPKLDHVDYAEKLTAILRNNDIRSVTVARMQVPCCGGLENAVRRAVEASGKNIPLQVVIITAEGKEIAR